MPDEIKHELLNEAKRIEEDTLYSARRHFITADIWAHIHLFIGLSTAVVSALAGKSALFDSNNVVAGILAILASILATLMTFLNPRERANAHNCVGNKYLSLRNNARIFYNIELHANSDKELMARLKELAMQRDELNQKSPLAPKWVYQLAKRGIESGESEYYVDKKR